MQIRSDGFYHGIEQFCVSQRIKKKWLSFIEGRWLEQTARSEHRTSSGDAGKWTVGLRGTTMFVLAFFCYFCSSNICPSGEAIKYIIGVYSHIGGTLFKLFSCFLGLCMDKCVCDAHPMIQHFINDVHISRCIVLRGALWKCRWRPHPYLSSAIQI